MPNKIRVLFAVGSLAGGGTERQIITILKHLDRARFAPSLYLLERAGELLDQVPDDVPIHAFSDRPESASWNVPGSIHRRQVRHLMYILREQTIDVVYDRTLHMTLVSAPATRRLRVPRISVVVADPQIDLQRNVKRFQAIKRRMLHKAYANANRVIAVSAGIRDALMDMYQLPAHKVVTIHNMIDLDRVDRMVAESAGLPDPPDEEQFRIVAAGRLQEQKGFFYLLQAMDELIHHRGRSHLHLQILGQGPLLEELQSFVQSYDLQQHVCFAGFVDNPLAIFKNSHLFCLSSLYEGMPNALLEAMACRVPVLSTDCPSGPREMLADGKYGLLVPAGDSLALADAVEEIIEDYDRCLTVAESARDFVGRRFALTAGIRQTEQFLADIVRS